MALGTTACVVCKDPIAFFAAYEFQRFRTVPLPAVVVKSRRRENAGLRVCMLLYGGHGPCIADALPNELPYRR